MHNVGGVGLLLDQGDDLGHGLVLGLWGRGMRKERRRRRRISRRMMMMMRRKEEDVPLGRERRKVWYLRGSPPILEAMSMAWGSWGGG